MGTLRKLLLFLYTDSCRLYKLSLALPLIENFQHFYNKKNCLLYFYSSFTNEDIHKGRFFLEILSGLAHFWVQMWLQNMFK